MFLEVLEIGRGKLPNTDTLGISETLDSTKTNLMNKIFIIIQIV